LQHLDERIAEEILILSVVETPCHLLQVGWEMLYRDFMPCAYNAALEERECRLDCVRGHAQAAFVPNVFLFRVIHLAMLAVKLRSVEVVELGFVRHDDIDRLVYVAGDNLIDLVLIQVRGGDEMEMPATLTDAHHRLMLLPLVRVLRVTADVHLVNLNRALEFVFGLFHCLADAMAEIPRSLVRSADHALDLIRRNPLARFGKQIRNEEPFSERQMRVVKDRAYSHGELVFA